MFSFDWIVLNKKLIKDNKSLISIFSREYWRISAWLTDSKKKTSVDLWNIYNFSSKTESAINKIESIKTKYIIKTETLWYEEINNILIILAYLDKVLPSWIVTESLFDEYHSLVKNYIEDIEKNKKACSFFLLKSIKKLWIAKPPEKSINWDVFVKVFSLIEKNNLDFLMRINWIKNEDINEINNYNTNILNNYIN